MTQTSKTGRAQSRHPTETDESTARGGAKPGAWFHLILILESDRLLDGGARYALHGVDEISFGRAAERGATRDRKRLRVTVQGAKTSENHARLRQHGDTWTLEDAGSKNGTKLNGDRIVEPTPVRSGDVIQIGRAYYLLRRTVLPEGASPITDIDSDRAGEASMPGFPTLVPEFSERLRRLKPALASGAPIVMVGETGTGKEFMARAIHLGSRPDGPFVAVDCPALAPNLVEGQLFGFLKGAYSDAGHGDQGLIRSANHGTLLLDEILDLPIAIQVKLLRVLQQQEVVSLGTSRSVKVDVRFVAAAHSHLRAAVEAGTFRADLRARLEGHVIELPPLRKRREDLGLLSAAILKSRGITKSAGFVLPSKAVWRMLGYSWPANIRELEKAIGRAADFAQGGILEAAAFEAADGPIGSAGEDRASLPPFGDRVGASEGERDERNLLVAALKKHQGKVVDVAKEMNLNRGTVYRRLERLRIDQKSFRAAAGSHPAIRVAQGET